MSIRTGLATSVMAACMLPGFAYAEGGVQTQKDITWGLGLEIAQAAIAECAKRNVAISVAVVDRAGRMRVFIASDNPTPHSLELARRKAYTARTFRQPSAAIVKRIQDEPAVAGFRQYTRVIPLAGGLPIKVGDDVIGAVGVSGSPGKDDECAQAGIDKVADQLK